MSALAETATAQIAIHPAPHCYQVNLHPDFGGGEVYTSFLTRALIEAGWRVTLFVNRRNSAWSRLELHGARIVPVGAAAEINAQMRDAAVFTLCHGQPPQMLQLPPGQRLAAIAHMPVHDRRSDGYLRCDRIFGVSGYVIETLRGKGIANVHPEPWYGVAEYHRGGTASASTPVQAQSIYNWDLRKGRDRLLSWLEPGYRRWLPQRPYQHRPGMTLGIVSRITPIKHFDELLALLASHIARYPEVTLDIFGAGGYASVRDLKRSLAPLRGQVRWWGHQQNVEPVYALIDYLLVGLPEQEALGLNVIEAQMRDRAVLAIDLPPFSETIRDGKTGYLYADPRRDGGAGFARLLATLVARSSPLRPYASPDCLTMFSPGAFRQRVVAGLAALCA